MKYIFVYTCLFLCVALTGCSNDQLSAGDSEVIVTVSGASAFGEWERDLVGPESQVEDFTTEAIEIVQGVAEDFNGAIEVDNLSRGAGCGGSINFRY